MSTCGGPDDEAPTVADAGHGVLTASPRERLVSVVSLAAALATAAVMVRHGPWNDPGWWMTAPFVMVWCCVPYAWVARTLRGARDHEAGARLAVFAAVLVVLVAVWVLWRYQVIPGERGGRVFLMLPIWQGLAFAPLALLARWLRPASGTVPP